MDPLCGMTRAVRYLALGHFPAAWRYNPASYALAAFAAIIALRFAVGMRTGRWYTLVWRSPQVLRAIAVVMLFVLWANQQVNAALLR